LGFTVCRPVALLKGPLTPLVGIKRVCHGPGYWCGAWCKASFSVRRVRTWTFRLVRAGNRRQSLLEDLRIMTMTLPVMLFGQKGW